MNDYDPDSVTPLILAVWNGHFDAAAKSLEVANNKSGE